LDQTWPESYPLHDPDFEGWTYDPDRAKELIEEAGAEGLSIELTDSGNSYSRSMAQAVQPMLEAVGLQVSLTPGDPTAPVARFQKRSVGMLQGGLGSNGGPLLSLERFWLPGGAYQWALHPEDNAELTSLYEEAVSGVTDAEGLDAIYRDMGAEINDLALDIPICQPLPHTLSTQGISVDQTHDYVLDMRFVGVAKG
jgi:ABC-type transport system substrate-binding protein